MFKIIENNKLTASVFYMKIEAPMIAAKALPGQFILLRVNETGERVPFTIADYDRDKGWISIIYQVVGKTTMLMSDLKKFGSLLDLAGPLGMPSHLEGYKKAAVVGGGLGCAIAYPQAKKLHKLGASVDIIAGFRSSDFIILENEMKACGDRLVILTDDGTNGNKGLVTDGLKRFIEGGAKYDVVIAIGPPVMMKFVSALTKEYRIKTIVSLNPIMIDGTGMCGGCRVVVGVKTKFACIDGPDFDGHEVDFDGLITRLGVYRDIEQTVEEKHKCRLREIEINF